MVIYELLKGEIKMDAANKDLGILNDFVSLESLLAENDVAILATAIEQKGIYTWDRFGRFVIADDASKSKALELLAHVYEYDSNVDGQQLNDRHPLVEAEGPDNPFRNFGWENKNLPDFAAIRNAEPDVKRPSGERITKVPHKFIDELIKLLIDISKKDKDFDVEKMPGEKSDFYELVCKHFVDNDIKFETFKTYIKPFCSFIQGNGRTDYYRKLFPEYFR